MGAWAAAKTKQMKARTRSINSILASYLDVV